MALPGIILKGDEAVYKALMGLPDQMATSAVRNATRDAMKPVITDARVNIVGNVKMNPEALQSYVAAMTTKTKVYRKTGAIVAVVGARDKREPHSGGRVKRGGYWRNWANLAHFFEKGVKPHSTATKRKGKRQSKGGQHPGIPAQPHIEPAYRSQRAVVIRTYGNWLGVHTMKQFRRLYKQHGGLSK